MSRFLLVPFAVLAFGAAAPALADDHAAAVKAPASPATAKPADDPWAGRNDLFVPPNAKLSTKVELGAVQRFTLPNGLQVIAVSRHGAPIVDVTLAVRTGGATEPKGLTGVAQFTASMLRKGTQKRTADEISEQIDTAGASLDADNAEIATFVSCNGRSRDFGLCLDMLSDIVEHPNFPETEMGEIHDQIIAGLEQARDNPIELAALHAGNLYFGDDDPRGRVPSKRSVNAINRAAIVAYHDTWYRPNNSILAISGDFDAKALRGQLTKWFGGWPRADVPKLPALTLPAPGPLKVRVVDKPDATQSQIVIVGPGIAHGDPDYCATKLMNYTLGGGVFSSRLMKVVRSEGAKTYHASSRFEASRDPGSFIVTTFTRNPEVANTVKLALGEVDKMKRGGPTAAELTSAKDNQIGGYGLKFETGSDVARQLLIADLDGLPADYVNKVPACYDAVTLPQAAAAARAHLRPQAIVVVGPNKEVTPLLTAAKLAPTETIGYTEPVNASDRAAIVAAKKQALKAADEVPAAEVEQGRMLLQLAIKQQGLTAATKVADLHVEGTASFSRGGMEMPGGFEAYYVPGHGQSETMTLNGSEMTQVYLDGKAFLKAGGRTQDMPGELAALSKDELWRNPHLILWNAAQPGTRLRRLPPVTEGKSRYDVLQVTSSDGTSAKLYLDAASHRIARMLYEIEGKSGTTTLSDYKREGGIEFPRHVVTEADGARVALTVDKIQLNKGVPKDAFAR